MSLDVATTLPPLFARVAAIATVAPALPEPLPRLISTGGCPGVAVGVAVGGSVFVGVTVRGGVFVGGAVFVGVLTGVFVRVGVFVAAGGVCVGGGGGGGGVGR